MNHGGVPAPSDLARAWGGTLGVVGVSWLGLAALVAGPPPALFALFALQGVALAVGIGLSERRRMRQVHAVRIALERSEERRAQLESSLESSRTSLERALARNDANSTFLERLSHELRTPLSTVIGYTEMAQESAPRGSETAHDLVVVDTAARHVLHLLDELLDVSRIQASELRVRREAVHGVEVVEACAHAVEPLIRRGVELRVDVLDRRALLGDAERLRQIVLNLLTNATKFTREGEIVLTVSAYGSHWRLDVRDTGPGIPNELRDVLFERDLDGGIGLSIARDLAALMDGRLSVQSSLGSGSTFTLELPLAQRPPKKSTSTRVVGGGARGCTSTTG